MPKRPCLRCGVLSAGSYCPRHRPKRDSPGRWTGPGAGSFRERTLAKAGGRCERCGSDDRVEAHHVLALSEGGSNDAATNGQALCFECHKAIERGRARPHLAT